MNKIKVSLEQAPGHSIVVEVDPELIKNAAILVYRGGYYVFGGAGGHAFNGVKFVRVAPPVGIPGPEEGNQRTSVEWVGGVPVRPKLQESREGFSDPVPDKSKLNRP